MKFKGTVIGEASGSVASMTFSHNRGGQYIRQRAVPVNSNTTFQQNVRNSMSLLTSNWLSVLTAAQRSGWDSYAAAVPISDTLGEPRNIGGVAMYCRSNIARIQAGLTRIDAAPTTFNLGSFTNPGVGTVSASADTVGITFTNTDAWAIAAGGFMGVWLSRPQNPTINYFKGPYRFAGVILGAGTPPTSPATITAPFPFGVGHKIFIQIRVGQVDGRYSSPFRTVGIGA